MTTLHRIATSAIILSVSLIAFSADEKPRGPGGGKDGQRKAGDVPIEDLASLFRTDVPAHPRDVVLGRPTKNSITASVPATPASPWKWKTRAPLFSPTIGCCVQPRLEQSSPTKRT